jgi:ribonuclease D
MWFYPKREFLRNFRAARRVVLDSRRVMQTITDTDSLAALCGRLATAPFVTVDTEFMRESTFYPKLCLVQVAGPDDAAAIDPLAEGMNLDPFLELLRRREVAKVFHAARQDLEIFLNLMGELPAPVYDTQVAAMVCGFGEQASYETLCARLAKATIDKSSRFTDWSRRPLSQRQVTYALSDVTHLRTVYQKLEARIARSGRAGWVAEEMATLTDATTYVVEPREAWQRIRTRSHNPKFLAVLRELAAWRELEARARDIPRSRVLRDEALLEIASDPPADATALSRVRGLSKSMADGRHGQAILAALARAEALDPADYPRVEREPERQRASGPLIELLKVLLKMKCDEHDVAQKLVATVDDLDRLAVDDQANVPALSGWRREMFGEAALALKRGELALAVRRGRLAAIPLPGREEPVVAAVAAAR